MNGTSELLKKMICAIGESDEKLKVTENDGSFEILLDHGTSLNDLVLAPKEDRISIVSGEYSLLRQKYGWIHGKIFDYVNSQGFCSETKFQNDEDGNFVLTGRVFSGESPFNIIGNLDRNSITSLLNEGRSKESPFTFFADDVLLKNDSLAFNVYTRTDDGKIYLSRVFSIKPTLDGKIECKINEENYLHETNDILEKITLLGQTLSRWFNLGVGFGDEVT